MVLDHFRIGQGDSLRENACGDIARVIGRARRLTGKHAVQSAGSKEYGTVKEICFARLQILHQQAGTDEVSACHEPYKHMVIKPFDQTCRLAFACLIDQGAHQHLACEAADIGRAAFFLAAEIALCDPAVFFDVKRHAEGREVRNDIRRFRHEAPDCLSVRKKDAAFYGIRQVVFDRVCFPVMIENRVDAALGEYGLRALRRRA